MSQALPVGNFRFLYQSELEEFDVSSAADDSETGYILECDLHYPDHLHPSHNDYPMAPEKLKIEHSMLSPHAKSFEKMKWEPCEKLAPNLMDKSQNIVHYRNLKFYAKHGLVISKIHRVLSFIQKPWLKPWVDHCTQARQLATSEFESNICKLKCNAIFGKSLEQQRGRKNIRLIVDPQKLLLAVSKPSFIACEMINKDLTLVKMTQCSVLLNKPIYTGFAILDFAKLLMYEFYYEYLMVKYGERFRLCYTDTDSFIFHVQTKDLHADMLADAHLYDTSNFPTDHPNYSNTNEKVVGKMKSETGALHAQEFVGLRSKMYSLQVSSKLQKHTAKGIKKSYVKKKLPHEHYVKALGSKVPTTATFKLIRSQKHILQTVEVTKTCLAAFDDKRYILSNNIDTLAYGHYLTRS